MRRLLYLLTGIGVVSVVTLMGSPWLALADSPGGHLTIEQVVVDLDATVPTLTIEGTDLDFGGALEVTLAQFPPLGIIGVPTDSEIIAALPPTIDPGDYLLTVSRGNGKKKNDTYDLTIGAVGPIGPQGVPGMQGPQGPQGIQGPVGPAGSTQTLETTRAQTVVTVPPNNGVISGQVTCPAGYFIMSPGYQHLGAPLIVFDLRVDVTSATAVVGAKNPTTTPWDITVYANCIRLM